MSPNRVLIVDDEEGTRDGLRELVAGWGYDVSACASGEEAVDALTEFTPHVVLSDLMMPGGLSGLELMAQVRERFPNVSFILLTGHGTIDNATQAMREGAYDYLTKPVDLSRLRIVLEKAFEWVRSREEVVRLTRDLAERGQFGRLVGRSPAMREVYRLIEQAAPARASVLITGESGTGKEVVARTLHEQSPRRGRPFVAVNCAAIPQTLLESEILGHEKGSFTGATSSRAGCFELANGGTLLLDEIGEMPPELQAKLLRVLEERTIRRVGGRQEFPVDVRVLSSTNIDIGQALQEGKFREDLFYRLNVFNIRIPPLRERPEDLTFLARHFIEEFAQANDKPVTGIAPAALQRLRDHDWPGNVRELRNALERAVIVARGPLVEVGDLPSFGLAGRSAPPLPGLVDSIPPVANAPDSVARSPEDDFVPSRMGPLSEGAVDRVTLPIGTTVEEAERILIIETLKQTRQNKTRAAEVLGISTKTLHNKLKLYRQAVS